MFDAVMAWDVPDYLPEEVVKPAIERIHTIMKPGGILLAFFHTRDAGSDAPYYRYHIGDQETLELQRGPQFPLRRVFNNRNIENLFRDYASIKFFLGRDNVREVIVIR
jgi:SAM-dependent methyltransferase